MQAEIDLRKQCASLPDSFLVPHHAHYSFPAKALHDPASWEQIKSSYTNRFRDRDPQATIDQWQACLDFDCRARLKTRPVPMHVIAVSEDVQTTPVMCKVVSDLALHGVFHQIPGVGQASMIRHRPDIVVAKLRDMLASELLPG